MAVKTCRDYPFIIAESLVCISVLLCCVVLCSIGRFKIHQSSQIAYGTWILDLFHEKMIHDFFQIFWGTSSWWKKLENLISPLIIPKIEVSKKSTCCISIDANFLLIPKKVYLYIFILIISQVMAV